MNPVVEEAARHLSRWRGTGMAWHAELEWTTPEDADNAANERLPIAWRGKLEDGAAKSVRGSSRVRQHRTWTRSAGAAVMPCHRPGSDVSAALAMAKLDGPLEPLLMLVCCEDLARWPEVRCYAMAALRHPHGHEAVTDAMHRIMWRRPVMPLEMRAKALHVRKDRYARIRAFAERTLEAWLLDASEKFLSALE